MKNLEDFSLIISGLMDQVNREEASRGKQLLQKLTMGGNTIRLPPKDPQIRDPLALPSPTGTKRTNLSEINIPPALGPKTILSPGQPQASRPAKRWGGRGAGTKLGQWAGQSHARTGGLSRRKGSREWEVDRLEAGVPSITTFWHRRSRAWDSKLRPGLRGHYKGFIVKTRGPDISLNSLWAWCMGLYLYSCPGPCKCWG